jgi:hypothetical protein
MSHIQKPRALLASEELPTAMQNHQLR